MIADSSRRPSATLEAARTAPVVVRAPISRATSAILWVGLLALAATSARAAERPPATAREADALVARAPSRERDALLRRWGKGAALSDIAWVLRHDAERLAGAEAPLVEAALELTSKQRVALRQRLVLRLASADQRRGRGRLAELKPSAAGAPPYPRASVFRVGALLPDSGAYEATAANLRAGLEIGLAWQARSRLPVDVDAHPTGDDDPPRALEALGQAGRVSGVLVGEIVERPTLALAAGALAARLPLIVPSAIPEASGLGPGVFRVGPSDVQRGLALARSVLGGRPRRVGILVSSRDEHGGLLAGLEAGTRAQGASPSWRQVYPAGSTDFKAAVRALVVERVELLFWDGDPRELEALARQLAAARARVELCGGAQLDPERHHTATRSLFEGARFVGEDWQLAPWAQAALDSALSIRGETASGAHVRGWLAARLISIGLSNGALSPEELTEALTSLAAQGPNPAERGFVQWTAAEATLPVYVVRNGKPVIAT